MTLKIFSKDSTKTQRSVIVLIILLVVLMTSGFRYAGWNSTYAGWISNIIYTMIFLYYFSNVKYNYNANFKSVIILLTFLPFLSSFNAYLRYGQNFYESYLATASNSLWLFYFFFHKWEVKEATLLRAFLLLSFFVLGVQVYQNLFPEKAIFGTYDTETMESSNAVAEVRNGILRFRVGIGGYFSVPILLAFWCFVKNKMIDSKMLVIVMMLSLSIYLMLTRQIIAAYLFAFFMSFYIEKKLRIWDYVIMLFLVTGLYYSYDVLFAEFSRTAIEETSNENIRVIAYNYFIERDTEDIFAWLIGHGMPKCDNFMHEMSMLIEMCIFASDVGFTGKWFYVGLPFILICYNFLYLLFWKYKKYTPTYIRLFVIYGTVMSVMIFPMEKPIYYLVWAIMAYITDLHINNSPLALESTKSKRID